MVRRRMDHDELDEMSCVAPSELELREDALWTRRIAIGGWEVGGVVGLFHSDPRLRSFFSRSWVPCTYSWSRRHAESLSGKWHCNLQSLRARKRATTMAIVCCPWQRMGTLKSGMASLSDGLG